MSNQELTPDQRTELLEDIQAKVKELLQDLVDNSPEKVRQLSIRGVGIIEDHAAEQPTGRTWTIPRLIAEAIIDDAKGNFMHRNYMTRERKSQVKNYIINLP